MKLRILLYWLVTMVLAVMVSCTGDSITPQAAPSENIVATIPCTINIVVGVTDLEVYTNPEMTEPATSIDWPDAAPGAEVRSTLYIDNVGTSTVFLHQRVLEDIMSWASISFAPLEGGELTPDTHGTWTLRLFINEDAELGPKSFTWEIYEVEQ